MKRLSIIFGVGVLLGLALPAMASEKTAKAEEELDARLGRGEKAFVVNLAALKTRSELREKSQVRTGLPSYDQRVENAQSAPASLMDMLNMPEPVRTAPRSDAAPPEEDNNNANNPNCYIGQFGELVCP